MIGHIGNEAQCIKSSLLTPICMLVLLKNDTILEKIGCLHEYSSVEILASLHHFVGDSAINIRIMISGNNNIIMLTYIFQFDQFLIMKFGELHNSYTDIVMIILTKLWDYWFLWIFLTIIFLIISKFRHIGYTLTAWLGMNVLLWEWIIKHIFYRDRPFQELSDIILLISEPITSSFPSGHSSASWCFAAIFTYFFWKKYPILVTCIWIVAMWITFSRLYLQVHYPSDILGGIFVGLLCWFTAIWLSGKLLTIK